MCRPPAWSPDTPWKAVAPSLTLTVRGRRYRAPWVIEKTTPCHWTSGNRDRVRLRPHAARSRPSARPVSPTGHPVVDQVNDRHPRDPPSLAHDNAHRLAGRLGGGAREGDQPAGRVD